MNKVLLVRRRGQRQLLQAGPFPDSSNDEHPSNMQNGTVSQWGSHWRSAEAD